MSADPSMTHGERRPRRPERLLDPGAIAIFDARQPLAHLDTPAAYVLRIEPAPLKLPDGIERRSTFGLNVLYLAVEGARQHSNGWAVPIEGVGCLMFASPWVVTDDKFNTDPKLGPLELERGNVAIAEAGAVASFGRAHDSDKFAYPIQIPETWFQVAFYDGELYVKNSSSRPLVLVGYPVAVEPSPQQSPQPSALGE